MFVATITVPGYLPMDDEPPVFETADEAWAWLAEEREYEEDCAIYVYGDPAQYEFTETVTALRYLASGEHEHGDPDEDWPTNSDGTGTVYGGTPGYDGEHDLGLVYRVTEVWMEAA